MATSTVGDGSGQRSPGISTGGVGWREGGAPFFGGE